MEKKLLVNISASLIYFMVNTGISFMLTPYIVENIGVDANGYVQLSNNIVSYASLLTIALNAMAGRYISIELYKKDYDRARVYFNSVLISNAIMAITLLAPLSFVIYYVDKLIEVPAILLRDVQLLLIFVFFNFLLNLLTATWNVAMFATNNLYLQSIVNVKANILKGVITVLLFAFFKPSLYFIGLTATLTTVYTVFSNLRNSRKLVPELKVDRKYYNLEAVKELIGVGIWNVFSQLSGIMSTGLDLLITNLFVGSTAMGVLALSKTIPTIILSLFATISNAFAPNVTKLYAEGKFDELGVELKSAIKFLSVFTSVPMAGLIIFGKDFYSLWVPNQDAVLLSALTIACCMAYIFALPLEPLWSVFTVTNKMKVSSVYLFKNSVISISVVFISVFLVEDDILKLFIIAGTSSLIGVVRALTFLPRKSAELLGFDKGTFHPVIKQNVVAVTVLCSIYYVVSIQFNINTWGSFILICGTSSVIGLMLSAIIVLSKEERKKLLQVIVTKLVKRGKV